MGTEQLKELKRLQKEKERLRRAVSDLTLDKLILKEAASWISLAYTAEKILVFNTTIFWGDYLPKAQFGLYLKNVSGVLTTATLQDSYYC